MLSHFTHARLCATPWAVAHQATLSMGFSRQEYWSGLPCPPPGDLPDPGIKPVSLLHWQAGSFTTSAPWEDPHYILSTYLFSNRKFEPFGHLCPIFPSSDNHKSDLFFPMSLSVSQAQLTCNTMLVPGAHHSDSTFLYISK